MHWVSLLTENTVRCFYYFGDAFIRTCRTNVGAYYLKGTPFYWFFFTWKFCDLFIKYINEWYGIGFILINKWMTRDQVTKILIAHREKQKKKQVFCKFFTKIIIFEQYVSLTNMYCLLCNHLIFRWGTINKQFSIKY